VRDRLALDPPEVQVRRLVLAEIRKGFILTSCPGSHNTFMDLLLLGTHTVHKILNH